MQSQTIRYGQRVKLSGPCEIVVEQRGAKATLKIDYAGRPTRDARRSMAADATGELATTSGAHFDRLDALQARYSKQCPCCAAILPSPRPMFCPECNQQVSLPEKWKTG